MPNRSDAQNILFRKGTNYRAYEYFGSHAVSRGETNAVVFRVWAPKARAVSVVGDFNGWDEAKNPMKKLVGGIWEATIEGVKEFDNYKYAVRSAKKTVYKSDPFAYHFEVTPSNASKVYFLPEFKWRSADYEKERSKKDHFSSPMNVYEVNLASWKKNFDGSYLTYDEICEKLVPYVKEMGYTHVEFMPLSEYPFDGSWGYQVTGYFGITSRFGTPDGFMRLVDRLHEEGVGVILDWVPAHFPKDEHGLIEFDGTTQYEDSRKFRKEHKTWGTRVFNYGKSEVRSFLISSALYYFDKYRIDGLRVDAVASMLYLDYDKSDGEWKKNELGTNINLEAVEFIKKLNSAVFENYPYALMIAEESSAFPKVTAPVSEGGLGFNFKWNMGWMNDTLSYISIDPYFRSYDHNKLTFAMTYSFGENYVLPISHDEVVHGKRSLIGRMPGEYEKQFAGVRLYIGFMMAHPGKKLTFMGQEYGQFREWADGEGLEFFLLQYEKHAALKDFFAKINAFYKAHDALYSIERDWRGFSWLVVDDNKNNMLAFERVGLSGETLVCIFNFSGIAQKNYHIGVDCDYYEVVFSSDEKAYGGGGTYNKKHFVSAKKPMHGKNKSITVNIEALSFLYLTKKD